MKIHKKTPVTESLINKVAGSLQLFYNTDSGTGFTVYKIFKNNYFEELKELERLEEYIVLGKSDMSINNQSVSVFIKVRLSLSKKIFLFASMIALQK